LSAELLIQSEGAIYGAVCSGIDYSSYTASTRLEDKIMLGHPDAQALEDNGIILGFDLAINLNVSLRDQVQLSAPVGTEATPFGLLPRSRKFTVIGIYSSGIPDYDLHYCFIPLSAAQYFTRTENAAEFIEVRTRDADKSWYYRKLIDNELPDEYVVNDWSDYEANLFNAIKLEKVLMILVLSLIILLAGFNMSGNLNRLVTEKKRDIGIMFAFGVKRSIVRRIFLNTSFYIGISGILLGMVFASGFLLAQLKWQFIKIPVSGFPIQELPVDLRTGDFVIIPILAMLITLLSALVPTARSNEVSAIEIIQK
jgi:lipoprotein-releasing system permease protein